MHVCRGRNDSTLIVHSVERRREEEEKNVSTALAKRYFSLSLTLFLIKAITIAKERLLLFSLHVRIND